MVTENKSFVQAGDKMSRPAISEIVLLMMALSKGGKTTLATALCNPIFRGLMLNLNNCRTQLTVDWTYSASAVGITLIEVLLNFKAVFGTDQKERFTRYKLCEILDSEDGQYLTDVFGIEKPDDTLTTPEELENYVLEHIKQYIDNCDDQGLSKLIKNRKSNRFLRRIKVTVPPVERFKKYFEEKNISLVLRDTRGLMDIDPEEATSLNFKTMQELGLDNIDAVLMLGTSAPFTDTVGWYKNAYKGALESVPIFIMTRPDTISMLYDIRYGIDEKGVTEENVNGFLKAVREGTEKGIRDLPNSYLQCYRLLEQFEIGTLDGSDFTYNYKVYNNKELCYVYPNSNTLLYADTNKPDYNCPDYKLYEMIVFANLNDMINRIIENNGFVKAIDSQIKNDFVGYLANENNISICPSYNKYGRSDVCNSIKNGPILGPRDGIVTTDHGDVIYLGTVTSAVSSRVWIRDMIDRYTYSGTVTNADGTPLVKHMPEECQINLIRMALKKIVEDNTDHGAYFRYFYFIDRYIVRDAILKYRKTNNMAVDALDNVVQNDSDYIFR